VEKKDSIRGKWDREEDCTLYRRLISSLASCSIYEEAFNLCSFIRKLIVQNSTENYSGKIRIRRTEIPKGRKALIALYL